MSRKAPKRVCVYVVPPGIEATVILGGKGDSEARVTECVTSKRSVFTASEVVIDPDGKLGRWGPASQNKAGEFARAGKMGFTRDGLGMVLIVLDKFVAREEV